MQNNFPSLPAGWEWKTLGNCFVVKDGTHDSPKFFTTGYPLYTSKNLSEKGLDNSNFKYISDDDYHKINLRSKVDYGDLLFAMIGTIGNPTIVDFEPNFAIKNMALFKPKDENASIEYLKYYLSSNTVIDKMISESNGATQKFVGLGYLRAFLIPLPPLDEQKRLISLLDTLFAKIDRSIELLSENITAADLLLTSALNTVFGEIKETSNFYSANDLAKKIQSGFAVNKKNEIKNGYVHLRTHNISTNGNLNFDYMVKVENSMIKTNYSSVYAGDILFNNTNSTELVGKTALVDQDYNFAFSNHLTKIEVDKTIINPDYFVYYFMDLFKKRFFASICNKWIGQSGINTSMLKEIQIPLPPLDIQTQTVEYLDSIRTKVEILKQVQNDKIKNLKALKASILDRAFKGEL